MRYYKIAIDIGHARTTGASGNGLQEHEVSAKLARYVKQMLQATPHIHADIVDFPELSNKQDLAAAIAAVNAGGYDAVVSLHCDCAGTPSARGAHVIYKSAAGQALGLEIAERLAVHLPGRARTLVQRHDLAILNQTRPPAVLVECGFLSSPEDAEIIRTRPILLARAIAGGIIAWTE
ncbi:MAG: N-acetylmuramoyl-L-alanine amidase [Akkermansia sp.]|nr:N-acetylmuramoyl-L-alanine amidase [Akkermansia sp.]